MTGIQPWRQLSEQLQLWKLSPGISKALSQGGCQYFQRMFTSKCLPEDGWLFGKLLPRVLFVFPTYVLACKSRFHVTLSFVLPIVVLSLFPQESHTTDIYCFRRKGNWGRQEPLFLSSDMLFRCTPNGVYSASPQIQGQGSTSHSSGQG